MQTAPVWCRGDEAVTGFGVAARTLLPRWVVEVFAFEAVEEGE